MGDAAGGRLARLGLRLGIVLVTGAAMAAGLALAAALGGGGGAGLDAAARWLADGGRWWLLAGRVALAGLAWWRWPALVRRFARGERARALIGRRHPYLAAYLLVEALGPGGGMAFLVGLAV